jgi:hypothetical protein
LPFLNDGAGTSLPDWMRIALQALAGSGYTGNQKALLIKISEQKLYLLQSGHVLAVYSVSTSRYGAGNRIGSHKTPLGLHRVAEKIGNGCGPGEIIKARVPTGRFAGIVHEPRSGGQDVITTRILWLEGLETGVNRGPGVDSRERYIYIHGTPEEGLIGQPASIGCVRMKNTDVIALFGEVDEGTLVQILK